MRFSVSASRGDAAGYCSEIPELPVQAAELDCLNEVPHGDIFSAIEIGYGAAYLEDPVVGPG